MRKAVLLSLIYFLAINLTACGADKNGDIIPSLDGDIGIYTQMKESGELNISVMYNGSWDNKELKAAKKIFEDKFNGWTVNIKPEGNYITWTDTDGGYVTSNDEEAEERFANELPARLKSEGGPDIISLDSADKDRLIKEGLLEDLLLLVQAEEDFNWDMLLPGVLLTMSHEKALYGIPLSFRVRNLYFYEYPSKPAELPDELPSPWTWETMAEYFTPEVERRKLDYLMPMPPHELVRFIANEDYTYFYDIETGKYDFNSPVFREILETVEKLSGQGLLWDADFKGEFIYGKPGGLLLVGIMDGNIKDYKAYPTASSASGGYINYPLPRINGTHGMAITPESVCAISANAPDKLAAWEFFKILLSDEIQNPSKMNYQPVMSALGDEAVMDALGILPFMKNSGGAVDIAAYNSERYNFFLGINRLSGGQFNKPDVMEIIKKHAALYFQGEHSLDATVNNLQKDVDGFLEGSN